MEAPLESTAAQWRLHCGCQVGDLYKLTRWSYELNMRNVRKLGDVRIEQAGLTNSKLR